MVCGRPSTKRSVWIAANTSWYVFNFRRRLIHELQQAGYEVGVLAPCDPYSGRLRALGVAVYGVPIDGAGRNLVRGIFLVVKIWWLFIRQRPGLVLSFTPKANIYACLAAARAGVPVIPNISGLGRVFVRPGRLEKFVMFLYRRALRRPTRVFFQNQEDMEKFIRARAVSPSVAERLPGSGVDVARFAPTIRSADDRSESVIFLLAGRLLWEKGVGEYVRAAEVVRQKCPTAKFQLLGFVDRRDPAAIPMSQLDSWVSEGAIEYLGFTDDVAEYYAAADCVVLPSYYGEGVPRTLLEAASMGRPIITTDMPGCRDVVDDKVSGFLCSPRDVGDLVDKMMNVLEMSRVEREEMGAEGRRKVLRQFDERIVITRYLDEVKARLG
jgi:glycosyltransferase involved in cell wall biosynthesis